MAFDDEELEPAASEAFAAAIAPDDLSTFPPELVEKRAGLQRQKIGEQDALVARTNARLEQDRARAVKAYDATGIQPGELEPWDTGKNREKYRTDPIESFGSLGSVFAILAAGFTRSPMENALNGAAAAMTAIKDGNDKEFDRAFDAWQKNNALAMNRHTLMQQSYQGAITLMSTDMAASRQQLQMLGAKYDDRQLLFLMENGMDKEALELLDKRNRAMLDGAKASQEITKVRIQQDMLSKDPDFNNEDTDAYKNASRRLMAFNRIYGVKQTPVQEIMGRWFYEHPNGTAEEAGKFYHDVLMRTGGGAAGDLAREIARQKAEYMLPVEEGGKGLTETEADTLARQTVKAASTAASVKPDAIELARRKKELMQPVSEGGKGLGETEADTQARKDMAESRAVISGNKRHDLQAQIARYDHSLSKIDGVVKTLDNYIGTTGAPGYARRFGERISNLAGSNRADIVQMMRDIEYLQLEGSRLLLGVTGRPLASSEKKIESIIAGLKAGDTTANTRRAMRELKTLYQTMRREQAERIDHQPPAGTVTPPAASGGDWYKGLKDRVKED